MPKRRAPARAPNRNNQTSPSSPFNGTSSIPDTRRATEQANALAPLFSSRGGFSLSDAQTILPGGDGSDDNLKRAVEAGFVEVLRAFFAVSASMLGSADIVAAMPNYMVSVVSSGPITSSCADEMTDAQYGHLSVLVASQVRSSRHGHRGDRFKGA